MTGVRNWVPLMSRRCLTTSIFVSTCKCSIGIFIILPNIMLSTKFMIDCTLFKCVMNMTGTRERLAYFIIKHAFLYIMKLGFI